MRLTMGQRPGLKSQGLGAAPHGHSAPRGSVRGVASLAITAMVLGFLLLTVQLWHTRGGSQAVMEAASEGSSTALSVLKGSPALAAPKVDPHEPEIIQTTASTSESIAHGGEGVGENAAAAAAAAEAGQAGSGIPEQPLEGRGAAAIGSGAVMYRGAPWKSHVGRWMLSCDGTAGTHVIKQVPKVGWDDFTHASSQ